MTMAQMYWDEFEREAATTRKFLERVPDASLGWKPHEKSMTAGQLGLHMASAPGTIIKLSSVDVAEAPDFGRQNPQAETVAQILKVHDESIAKVKAILPNYTDAQMQAIWQLKMKDKVVLSIPRFIMLRNILLNHLYHHRGQLGVYLRLLGAKVPSAYGPSGDELPDFVK